MKNITKEQLLKIGSGLTFIIVVVSLLYAYYLQCFYRLETHCHYISDDCVEFITEQNEIFLWDCEEGEVFVNGGLYQITLYDNDTLEVYDDEITEITRLK